MKVYDLIKYLEQCPAGSEVTIFPSDNEEYFLVSGFGEIPQDKDEDAVIFSGNKV